MTQSHELVLPSQEAKARRDEGMALAADAADARFPLWQHRALESLKKYLETKKNAFMTEDFRAWAETFGNLPIPPSGRAYGAVISKASRQGLISHVGYQQTDNPKAHKTPASVWIISNN